MSKRRSEPPCPLQAGRGVCGGAVALAAVQQRGLALQYVSVGAFVVVRNLGPLVTLGVEVALHRPGKLRCNWRTVGSCVAIALGVWMYEEFELRFSACLTRSAGLTFDRDTPSGSVELACPKSRSERKTVLKCDQFRSRSERKTVLKCDQSCGSAELAGAERSSSCP